MGMKIEFDTDPDTETETETDKAEPALQQPDPVHLKLPGKPGFD